MIAASHGVQMDQWIVTLCISKVKKQICSQPFCPNTIYISSLFRVDCQSLSLASLCLLFFPSLYMHISSQTPVCKLIINLPFPLPKSHIYLCAFSLSLAQLLASPLTYVTKHTPKAFALSPHTQTHLSHQPFSSPHPWSQLYYCISNLFLWGFVWMYKCLWIATIL